MTTNSDARLTVLLDLKDQATTELKNTSRQIREEQRRMVQARMSGDRETAASARDQIQLLKIQQAEHRELSQDIAKQVREQDRLNREQKEGANAAQGLIGRYRSLAIGIAGITAAASGTVMAIGRMVSSFANAGDEVQKMSIRTGFSAEAISELRYAAQLAGTSIQGMETGFRRMAQIIVDADRGVAEARRGFESLGVDFKAIQGIGIEQQFFTIVEALGQVEDETLKVALAQDVFGRSGTQLLPLLEDGAEGLEEMRQEARDLGLVFDREAADKAAQFNDELTTMKGALSGLGQAIGEELVVPIGQAADALTNAIEKTRELATVPTDEADIRQRMEEIAGRRGIAGSFAIEIDPTGLNLAKSIREQAVREQAEQRAESAATMRRNAAKDAAEAEKQSAIEQEAAAEKGLAAEKALVAEIREHIRVRMEVEDILQRASDAADRVAQKQQEVAKKQQEAERHERDSARQAEIDMERHNKAVQKQLDDHNKAVAKAAEDAAAERKRREERYTEFLDQQNRQRVNDYMAALKAQEDARQSALDARNRAVRGLNPDGSVPASIGNIGQGLVRVERENGRGQFLPRESVLRGINEGTIARNHGEFVYTGRSGTPSGDVLERLLQALSNIQIGIQMDGSDMNTGLGKVARRSRS